MCRWLAYRGSPAYLDSLIFEPEYSLVAQSLSARHAKVPTNGDGFGVGWYAGRETPGLFRDVLPAWNDSNLKSVTHQIRSPLFFAHVRASTGTDTSRSNCHPFSFGRWLFMHNGQIGGWEQVRRALENDIPDEYYRHRKGTTDSEALFFLLLAAGLENDPGKALAAVSGRVLAAMERAQVSEPFRFTAALTDGRRIIAVRYSSDAFAPTMFYCQRDGHLLLVSEPLDSRASEWQDVPAGQVLLADDGQVSLHAFAPTA